MNKLKDDVCEEFFSIHNTDTDDILVDIIKDRKYDIPDWVYKFINEDVILNIFKRHEKITPELVRFMENVEKTSTSINYKYLVILLIENDLLKYGFMIDTKKFCKYASVFCADISIPDIIAIFNNYNIWIDNTIPREYTKLLMKIIDKTIFNSTLLSVKKQSSIMDLVFATIKSNCSKELYHSLFSNLYDMYNHRINDNPTIKTEIEKCFIEYWSTGGEFIPTDMNIKMCEEYVYTISNTQRYPAFSKDLKQALIYNINKYGYDISYISNHIVNSTKHHMSNMDIITWELTDKEKDLLKYHYRSAQKINIKTMDYMKYKRLVYGNDNISFDEYKEFILRGGTNIDITSITDIYDIYEIIEFIMINLSTETLVDMFRKDIHITTNTGKVSLINHIIKYCIDINHSVNYNIQNRFFDIIFDNPDIIDMIVYESGSNKDYISYNELMIYCKIPLTDILSKSPSLIKYYDNLPFFIILSVISENPDAIQYIPWHMLTEDIILNYISKKGYFKSISFNNKSQHLYDDIISHISTEKLISIMKTGKGVGYCLDYKLPIYRRHILSILLKSKK